MTETTPKAYTTAVEVTKARKGKSRGTQNDRYRHDTKSIRTGSKSCALNKDGIIEPRLNDGVACLIPLYMSTVVNEEETNASSSFTNSVCPSAVSPNNNTNFTPKTEKTTKLVDLDRKPMPMKIISRELSTKPRFDVPRFVQLLDRIEGLLNEIEEDDLVRLKFEDFFPNWTKQSSLSLTTSRVESETTRYGFEHFFPNWKKDDDLIPRSDVDTETAPRVTSSTPGASVEVFQITDDSATEDDTLVIDESIPSENDVVVEDSEDDVLEIVNEIKKPPEVVVIDDDEESYENMKHNERENIDRSSSTNADMIYFNSILGTQNVKVVAKKLTVDDIVTINKKLRREALQKEELKRREQRNKEKWTKRIERLASKDEPSCSRCPETGEWKSPEPSARAGQSRHKRKRKIYESMHRQRVADDTESDSDDNYEQFLSKESQNVEKIRKQKWVYENEIEEISDFIVPESAPLVYEEDEQHPKLSRKYGNTENRNSTLAKEKKRKKSDSSAACRIDELFQNPSDSQPGHSRKVRPLESDKKSPPLIDSYENCVTKGHKERKEKQPKIARTEGKTTKCGQHSRDISGGNVSVGQRLGMIDMLKKGHMKLKRWKEKSKRK